ncbi:leucine-rich repeat-containing protein 71 isoform X2 [Bufo bufo]|uniref:leucine-rich repeat-containing protein 71 isoform X2 n=1 Tax=Bufo bufo TaxID=8384 RepID=UPI001ABE1E6D|nr:leucine-rich repeat-containing protein 71 isoform X2 [Bufo bufo]
MGKKTDKKDKSLKDNVEEEARSAGFGTQDRPALTAEDYQCSGNLEQDFSELCSRLGYIEIPKVIPRPRPPSTPASEKNMFEEPDYTSDKESQGGTGPTKDRYSYFKPSIRVELESEDGRSVREISIRGWKIDDKMMGIFAKCLPALLNLHKINLWNVGLTDQTFSSFVNVLQHCPSVKVISLEGNPLPDQSYYKLLSDDLGLVHISLRNNQIDDEGARLISQALQSLKVTNKNLAALVLSYNHISDQGAGYIAQALRFNRSLLSLNLSSNQIGDQGARALAEVLGHFPLRHTEIVERRRLLLEKEAQEQPRSPGTSRHADSKSERPLSHHSNSAAEKAEKSQAQKAKSSVSKKKEKDPQKKEDKTNVSSVASGASTVTTQPGPAKKEDPKTIKKQTAGSDLKNARGKPVKSATKRAPLLEHEQAEVTEIVNPLLEQADFRDGKVYLPGNKVLISLNLSRNRVTEEGLKGFLAAIEAQVQETKPATGTRTHTGLLRLSLAKNRFPADCSTFAQIQEMMLSRDPIHKSSRSSVDEQMM